MNNGNNNNIQPSGDFLSWLIVLICLFAAPPLGVILLLVKLSKTAKTKANSPSRSFDQKYQNNWTAQNQYGQQAKTSQAYYQTPPSQQNTANQTQGHYYGQNQPPKAAHYNPVAQPQPSPTKPAETQAGQTASGASQPYQQQPSSPPYRQQQNYQAQSSSQYHYYNVKKTDDKKARKEKAKAEKKQSGKGLSGLLMFLGILFFIAGTVFLTLGISSFAAIGLIGSTVTMAVLSALFYSSALFSFIERGFVQRRFRRFNKYAAVIGSRDTMTVEEISKAVGYSVRKTEKTLQDMIDNGFFGPLAYIDSELDSFVISREAADKARADRDAAKTTASVKPVGSENQYVAVINELHMLCAQTSDPSICAKIQRIEEITVKIFRIVEDKPEKTPQIRRFMNYYLPTTLKLLHSYETLEKQGINGENIMSAKQEIERVLDTLAAGYEQQLDNLFRSDAIDISADINVLENLMEQDGLTNEGNIMKMSDGTIVKQGGEGTLKAAGGN